MEIYIIGKLHSVWMLAPDVTKPEEDICAISKIFIIKKKYSFGVDDV